MSSAASSSTMGDGDGLNELYEGEYERERLQNIKNTDDLLSSLGLKANGKLSIRPHAPSGVTPKKKTLSPEEERRRKEAKIAAAARRAAVAAAIPSRRSARVASLQSNSENLPNYNDDAPHISAPIEPRYNPIPKKTAPIIPSGPEYDDEVTYDRAPVPSRSKDGTLQFEGRWKGIFTPNVTPEEMFRGGAFGGGFFCDTYSNVLRKPLEAREDIADLPFVLPSSLVPTHLSNDEPDGDMNRWKVRAGQSLQEWEKAGWIWSGDPRGWAQWYCRFWGGRRCEDDERQVRRWLKVAGPTGRFKRALLKKIHMSGGHAALEDEEEGKVLRQCLWQWGYELNRSEYDRAMA